MSHDFFGQERIDRLRFICSDMCKNDLDAIASRAKEALNVLDRYHVISMPNRKVFVRTVCKHRQLLLNGFKARKAGISLGAVEGMNNKAKVTTKRADGFKPFQAAQIALYHTLGK